MPSDRELASAIATASAEHVWRTCELNPYGPLYFLPTREWISALSRLLDARGVRRVLEVGAGDGFLSACLARRRPDLFVRATDSGAWEKPAARMNARDRREFKGVDVAGLALGGNVEKLSAVAAVKRYRPDLVIVSWAPPGLLVEQVIRTGVRHVLDISVEGDVCGNGARTWRFAHEPLTGAIVDRALCRLDARPLRARATHVTLYSP